MKLVDMDRMVRDVIGIYPAWQPPRVEILIAGTIPVVFANEALLSQCVSNLLTNAVKFVAPGAQPKVRIWSESLDNRVRVWFEDNGVGIAKQNEMRIFRMFERIYPANEYDGTGIGLTIVRKAIERMGGKVGFESELGKGSRFWLELRKEKTE